VGFCIGLTEPNQKANQIEPIQLISLLLFKFFIVFYYLKSIVLVIVFGNCHNTYSFFHYYFLKDFIHYYDKYLPLKLLQCNMQIDLA